MVGRWLAVKGGSVIVGDWRLDGGAIGGAEEQRRLLSQSAVAATGGGTTARSRGDVGTHRLVRFALTHHLWEKI
jgi:hypothetical protein